MKKADFIALLLFIFGGMGFLINDSQMGLTLCAAGWTILALKGES